MTQEVVEVNATPEIQRELWLERMQREAQPQLRSEKRRWQPPVEIADAENSLLVIVRLAIFLTLITGVAVGSLIAFDFLF